MAKKKNEETEDLTPAAIELTIRREHVDFPHSIQLRRNGGEHVVEARTADFRHTENVGAKTVEAILRESGAALPEAADDEITLTFSPYNGEIMTIEMKKAAAIGGENSDDQS